MRPIVFAALAAAVFFALPASAGDTATLGVGRLFTNDWLGDGQDRWHTGSYSISVMRGPEGTGSLPAAVGALMEYRFSSAVIAPANLITPAPGDRPYAGILSAGAYSHFTSHGAEFALGGELVAVGPMTRLDAFHVAAHTALGMPAPSAVTRAGQLANAIYPVLAGEAARPIAFEFGGGAGAGPVLRPFVQARGGDEFYTRFGADLMIGPTFTSGVLARDETTGFLYQTLKKAPGRGFSFLVGADAARVFSSAWLPASAGYTLTPWRLRARAGAEWQSEHVGVFYGATWLGPEFAAQPGGQVLGSLQLKLNF